MHPPSPAPAASSPTAALLDEFIAGCREAFGEDLVSVTLFGSAAEDRARAVSDVNVAIVLRRFDPARARMLGESLRLGAAAIRLAPQFFVASELPLAARAFAEKFADMGVRRRVLFGSDALADHVPSADDLRRRLATSLLNLAMRLRHACIVAADRDDIARRLLGEFAGSLRACALARLEMDGERAASPREALERVAAARGPEVAHAVEVAAQARRGAALEAGAAERALEGLLALVEAMRAGLGGAVGA